jgi:hypothetical protein
MMHLLTFIVDDLVFLDERDCTGIVLASSLHKVGITYVDLFLFAF